MSQRSGHGLLGHRSHRHHGDGHDGRHHDYDERPRDAERTSYGADGSDGRGGAPPAALSPMERLAAHGWHYLFAIGLTSLVIGLLVATWPGKTLHVAGVLFGIYLVATGVLEIVAGFGRSMEPGMRVLTVIAGAISIVLGLICFRGRFESTLLLGLWIGFGLLIRGIVRATAGASSRPPGNRGWQIFGGVLTAAAGVVLIVTPFATLTALTLLVGVWLAVIGGWQIIESLMLRHRGRQLAGTRH